MKKSLKEKIFESLFTGDAGLDSAVVKRVKVRLETAFTKWLADPALNETDMRKFLMTRFNIRYSQAYKDIADVKFMLGNVSVAAKEWQRYLAIDMIKRGYDKISKAKSKLDVLIGEGMIKSALGICKVTKLSKEDPEPIDWDQIVPQNFEITEDVAALGIKKIPNLKEYQNKLRKKYGVFDEAMAKD